MVESLYDRVFDFDGLGDVDLSIDRSYASEIGGYLSAGYEIVGDVTKVAGIKIVGGIAAVGFTIYEYSADVDGLTWGEGLGTAAGAVVGTLAGAAVALTGVGVLASGGAGLLVGNWVEDYVKDFVDNFGQISEVEKLRSDLARGLYSTDRDEIAKRLYQSGNVKSDNGSTIVYNDTDVRTGAQVETTVVRNTETGQTRAVFTLVPTNSRVATGMEGNIYPAGKVQAGYELNALDRISELQNIWNAPPRNNNPQGSGTGPSDPNDPRGPWQIPGAPGDRTNGGTSGGGTATKGATPTKTESWQDKYGSGGGGGGGADSGKSGGATPTKATTTTSTKNDYGYTKVTETTKYSSGVTQTTTKQTVNTPAGPKEVTKTTTTPAPKPKDDPRKTGPQPILLDLDGNGVKITEYHNSTRFMTGKDGLRHRSSWAGAGDGVLFYDPDGRNAITEHRQYVFTEWNPTAAGIRGGEDRLAA